MPGFDRTGPNGEGRMTGRKMGRCTNFGGTLKKTGDEVKDIPDENTPENFRGRGFGRGRGCKGYGQGRQNRFRGGTQ